MRNALAISLALALTPLAPTSVQADEVDDLVTAEMARSSTPGLAIAVIDGGRIVRAQGYGLANVEHGAAVHADSLFKTGATGMQFTAAAIMLLVEDGAIELDAPVSRYLSGTPDKWRAVTVRQLLDHTSGLPATPNGDFRADYTNGELLAIIGAQDVNFPAGSRRRFSYAGYIVLGFVIEEVTGEHWAGFVRRRIFAPLGMRSARGIDEMAIIPNRAAGYEWRDSGLRNAEWIAQTANSTADGSLYLSALDYAIWAQAVSRRELLGARSWEKLARSAALADGAACPHVPGWSVAGADDRLVWSQSGNWQGFVAHTLRFPALDLSVAVYANGERADVQGVARALAGLTVPALASSPASPQAEGDPDQLANARMVIEAVAAGRVNPEDFVDFAILDLTELAAQYNGMLAGAGPLLEFALFDSATICGERQERYRARFPDGMFELRLGLDPSGRIGNLELVPVVNWTDPL